MSLKNLDLKQLQTFTIPKEAMFESRGPGAATEALAQRMLAGVQEQQRLREEQFLEQISPSCPQCSGPLDGGVCQQCRGGLQPPTVNELEAMRATNKEVAARLPLVVPPPPMPEATTEWTLGDKYEKFAKKCTMCGEPRESDGHCTPCDGPRPLTLRELERFHKTGRGVMAHPLYPGAAQHRDTEFRILAVGRPAFGEGTIVRVTDPTVFGGTRYNAIVREDGRGLEGAPVFISVEQGRAYWGKPVPPPPMPEPPPPPPRPIPRVKVLEMGRGVCADGSLLSERVAAAPFKEPLYALKEGTHCRRCGSSTGCACPRELRTK